MFINLAVSRGSKIKLLLVQYLHYITVAMYTTVTYIFPDTKRHHIYVCQLYLTLFQIPEKVKMDTRKKNKLLFLKSYL